MAGADLTLEDREWLQERSAILEYEAGLPRKEAEETAVKVLQKMKITQKSAWFVLQRLREACGNDLTVLRGIVEIDETYIGGKEKNKHESKKLRAGRGTVGKTAVVGMRERGGRTIAMPVANTDSSTFKELTA